MSTEICKTSLVQAESMMWEFILKGNFNMKYQEMDWHDTVKVV